MVITPIKKVIKATAPNAEAVAGSPVAAPLQQNSPNL
jgi:hypothetical protein